MRIVIDLQGAQTESRFRGIGRYSLALAEAMARQAGEHDLWVFLNTALAESIDPIHKALDGLIAPERMIHFKQAHAVDFQYPDNIWRSHSAELIREAFLADLQPDFVYLSSLFEGWIDDAVTSIGKLTLSAPTAVTLYDLIPLLNVDTYLGADWSKKWYMDKIESLKRANILLAISEYSRWEAMEHLGIDGKWVTNISSAISDIFRPTMLDTDALNALKNRYGITKPYLMYNGALELRKNIDRLLQAFAQLPNELRSQHNLILVGKAGEAQILHLQRLAKKLNIHKQVILTNYVSDQDLIALYSHCRLFVFPSFHEGFGLPALEAMACGAPTIGSNVTSIPEVIGRSDALFDPYDVNAISEKIAQVLTDADFSQSLRKYAIMQAAKFSWDNSAKCALNAIEHYHAENTPPRKSWLVQHTERVQNQQALIHAIATIPRAPVAPTEDDLLQVATGIAENSNISNHVLHRKILPAKLNWRIEGPFDSSYSLALLNRETALAIEKLGHRVQLHSTEGPGDFAPNPDFLRANPELAKLHQRAHKKVMADADVTSRNLYPPRVSDMNCRFNMLHHYAWEESGFPAAWVNDFNEHLQGITCLSEHVAKIMIDHGVTVPLSVSGCGVDHWERITPESTYQIQAKSFRFLHVSSCFPRKGADILLKAYGEAFNANDDVSLIIKTFPNPHNEIHQWLTDAQAQRNDFPEVLIIEDDLTDAQLKALYQQCHVLVAPSRAEGFGLPLAEAMLSGIAVVTTDWGGQRDFCNVETAWVVDYQFVPAASHLQLFDSAWAEPHHDQLTRILREVAELPATLRQERSKRGRELLLANYTWRNVATRLIDATRTFSVMPLPQKPHIGWISTWNTRCGIATYSEHLIRNIPTEITVLAAHATAVESEPEHAKNVYRCWQAGEGDSLNELAQCIEQCQLDILVVQFNYSLFKLEALAEFLTAQIDAGRIVIMMLHSTSDPIHVMPHKRLEKMIVPLKRCQRILVHTIKDLNSLKARGVIDNVTLFPHGILDYTPAPQVKNNAAYTLASYGFFLPHKGLLELIQAVALLHKQGVNIRLNMVNAEYPVPESAALIRQAKAMLKRLHLEAIVTLQTAYLSDAESLALLSTADLIVFPYQETGESASGAARYGLVSGRPVAVTPLAIFDDIAPAVHYLPGNTPGLIAEGIINIMHNENVAIQDTAERWREAHRYSAIGLRLHNILLSLASS